MFDDNLWSGSSMQQELLRCEVVAEDKVTSAGAGHWYYLKVGYKLIPLGFNKNFADLFQFSVQRNARAFETPPPAASAPMEGDSGE